MLRWIQATTRCSYGPLVRFAYGLRKDIKAVTAAVETDFSNGQTEGQINRLKAIKRQMYGWAGFTYLRARVLPCPALIPAVVPSPPWPRTKFAEERVSRELRSRNPARRGFRPVTTGTSCQPDTASGRPRSLAAYITSIIWSRRLLRRRCRRSDGIFADPKGRFTPGRKGAFAGSCWDPHQRAFRASRNVTYYLGCSYCFLGASA